MITPTLKGWGFLYKTFTTVSFSFNSDLVQLHAIQSIILKIHQRHIYGPSKYMRWSFLPLAVNYFAKIPIIDVLQGPKHASGDSDTFMCNIPNISLLVIVFSPMFQCFYALWKRQNTFGFRTFSESIEMEHWAKMGLFMITKIIRK